MKVTKKLRRQLTLGFSALVLALVGFQAGFQLQPVLVKPAAQNCVTLRVKGDQAHQSEFYVDENDPRWLVVVNSIEIQCFDKLPDANAPKPMPQFHPNGPVV